MSTVYLRVARYGGLAFVGIIAAVVLLIVAMYLEHFLPTELLPPTGPYHVGRASYFFSDKASSADGMQLRRELVAWIWYPAEVSDTAQRANYFPDAWLQAAQESWSGIILQIVNRDLAKVHVHSAVDARVAQARPMYPVVIMRAGGSALTLQYSTVAEDLASHGFVVVGFDAPYRTQLVVLPTGEVKHRLPQNDPEEAPLPQVERLLMMWVSDERFVLDRLEALNEHDDRGLLTHRLDLTKIGVFGHSFGGAQSLQLCHDDSRCKAAIDIDGLVFGSVMKDGVKQPVMFLMGDHHLDHYVDSESKAQPLVRNFHAIYERLPAPDRVALMIDGADHFSFADGAVVRSHTLLSALRALGLVIDGKRQLSITSACIRAFFGKYLNDERGALDACTQLEGVKPAKLVIDGQ